MAQQGLPVIQGPDPLGGLRQALTGFVGGTLEQVRNQQLAQQLGTLFPGQDFQGITNPRALQLAGQLGLQQAQPVTGANRLAGVRAGILERLTPEQQITSILGREPKRAGQAQVAGPNNEFGLPIGATFQIGPQGQLNILREPKPTTVAQQQATEVARIQRKPIDKRTTEETNILRVARGLPTISQEELIKTQITRNRAAAEQQLRAGGGILTPEQKISQTNVFRKEFDALSGDFRKIRDSFQRINAAAADPSAAGDLAIIFNFMKILDPGSVVRESEFATAENAAGVPDKIRNMWNKALTGERITFNRNDFVNQAANLFKAQQKTQTNLIDRYTKLSNRFGLNAQNVITETNIGTGVQPVQSIDNLDAINKEIAELEAKINLPTPAIRLGTGGLRF